jgi:hypothetical protein
MMIKERGRKDRKNERKEARKNGRETACVHSHYISRFDSSVIYGGPEVSPLPLWEAKSWV